LKKVQLTIDQGTQFPPYRFPLKVEVILPSGIRVKETVTVQAIARSTLLVDGVFNQRPTAIVLDPDLELLAKITSN